MLPPPLHGDPPPLHRAPFTHGAACAYCGEHESMQSLAQRLIRCRVCSFLLPLPRSGASDSAANSVSHGAPLSLGTVLRERYRLIDILGQGAHGLTFLAHHEFLNHPCVVKVLPHRIEDASDTAVRRLRNEASTGFRVNHPNVVRVLDGDTLDGIWYFVTEYVDGVDLAAAAQNGVTVDWRQAVAFAIDAARGLEAIHRAGLIHRDIKPGNLILGTDGHIRVADLGVARFRDAQSHFVQTGADQRAGTAAYAAPEVFAQHEQVDARADLYSLGVTLFELVTGSLPGSKSIYRRLLDSEPGSVSWPANGPADVPEWFVAAILRLLEAAPDRRFASAAALADYLERPSAPPVRLDSARRAEFPEARGLVVLPFENTSEAEGDDWLGHALADHLARSLAQLPGAYVVDLDQFLPTLERLAQRAARPRMEQLLEAGRLSGAATMVAGAFRRSGETIELSARVHQSAGAAPTSIEAARGALSALVDLEGELFDRLTNVLGLAQTDVPAEIRVRNGNSLAAEERFFTAKRAFLRGDYEAAMRLGKAAIDIDPDFGDALGVVGACCARMGRYDEAVEYNRRQQLLAAREGDERLKVQAQANMGSMHYFRGEYEAAHDCLARAARIADGLGLTTELAQIRNNLGFVLLQLGRQAEAEATFLRAVETLKKYGALVALVGPYNGMGHVLREQKRYEEARGYFNRALALAQESDDDVNMGVAYMNLGHCALLQGRLADAKHELAMALNILEQTSFWNGLARVYEYMADLNLRLSNCAEAARCAERRIELARRHSNLRTESAARRQKAAALRLAGRDGEAAACLACGPDEDGNTLQGPSADASGQPRTT
jgi:serine/threonine protein kinase/Tfp pilus assembly protein PilF